MEMSNMAHNTTVNQPYAPPGRTRCPCMSNSIISIPMSFTCENLPGFPLLFKILSCFCYSVIWKPHTCGAKHFSGPATLKDWWECLKGYPLHDYWTKWGKAGNQHNNCISKLRWYRHKLRASWFPCFFETDFTKVQEMVHQGHHSRPLQQYS